MADAVTDLMEGTEARRRVDRIRVGLEGIADEVIALQRGQGWLALGYPTWAELCAAEFPFRLALPKDERQGMVGSFSEAGMSQQSQADFFGVTTTTIRRDQQGGHYVAPEKTTGLDGKQYSRPEPRPEPVIIDPFANWSEDEHFIRKQLEAGNTVVISLRANHERVARWAEDNGLFVRIDRRSRWGNPFEIPDDGDRGVVIAKYAQHYLPHKNVLQEELPGLRGKALACWCAPEPCHGDVLKAAAER